MENSKNIGSKNTISFTTPIIYEIVVLGTVNPNQSGYFSDMKIRIEEQVNEKNRSVLLGELKDQSALLGVLNGLYNMHHTIISVIIISEE